MTKNRFTLSQNGTLHTVRDNVKNKPLGVFEFKDDEFPVYFCFHKIIDLMNDLSKENEQLKAYKQKVAKAFKVAIKETTLTEQTENSLRAISKILEVDLE